MIQGDRTARELFDATEELGSEASQLRARIAELEAQAAFMRHALELCYRWLKEEFFAEGHEDGMAIRADEAVDWAEKALASDAGRTAQEWMAKLQKVAEAAKDYREQCDVTECSPMVCQKCIEEDATRPCSRCENNSFCEHIQDTPCDKLDMALDALAELEAK